MRESEKAPKVELREPYGVVAMQRVQSANQGPPGRLVWSPHASASLSLFRHCIPRLLLKDSEELATIINLHA